MNGTFNFVGNSAMVASFFEFFKELVLYTFMLIVNQEYKLSDVFCIRETTLTHQVFDSDHKYGLGLARTGVQ